ncbi:MAG: Do family serine endopeptidase [Bacteroidales bacterium]
MKKNIIIYLFLTVLISGLTSAAVVALVGKRESAYVYPENKPIIQKTKITEPEFPDFTFAAESAVKAVVHVKVVVKGSPQPYSLFDFFFGYGQPQIPREMEGAGSGVIISQDGYIVTNNHVIEGANDIEVTLENNQSFKAKLIGSDAATDVALLKIEASNLPFITFGDSDALRLGEWVLAIGNPYNLRSTITAGIVSAKARSMPSADGEFKIEAFIQTDAAVNSGNSGGALINTKGELVGINTAIASKTGAYSGYSFAVPTTIVKKVVEDMMKFGTVQRAMMGISMQDMSGSLVKEKGLKDTKGVYIAEVIKGGAADKAGIKESDVLISVNGVQVNSAPAVQEQISRFRPKDKISVEIIRDGKQKELSVVLEGRDAQIALLDGEKAGVVRLWGAEIKEASDEKLDKLGINFGVEVLSVADGKFKDAGVSKGFIITYVNQMPVRNVQDLQSVIQRSRRSLLVEGVYPDGKVVYYGMGI